MIGLDLSQEEEAHYTSLAESVFHYSHNEEIAGDITTFCDIDYTNMKGCQKIWALCIEPGKRYKFFRTEEQAEAARVLFFQ